MERTNSIGNAMLAGFVLSFDIFRDFFASNSGSFR